MKNEVTTHIVLELPEAVFPGGVDDGVPCVILVRAAEIQAVIPFRPYYNDRHFEWCEIMLKGGAKVSAGCTAADVARVWGRATEDTRPM